MRWLTWMATTAFVVLGGCGGSDDGDAGAPAPGGNATAAAPGNTKPPTSTSDAGQRSAGTSSESAVKDSQSPGPAGEPRAPEATNPAGAEATSTLEPEPADEGPTEMPVVNLGQGSYAQSTLLQVGATIPEITASNLDGEPTTVAVPAEGALLVLVFWDSKNAYSTHELRWLQRELVNQDGVRVVAVNRGESAETVRPIVEQELLSFPVILDPEASVFGEFATETVPRTYLVGEGGEILWLEVGFQGLTTIKTLRQAIAAAQAE